MLVITSIPSMLIVCSISFHTFILVLINLYVYVIITVTIMCDMICTFFCNLLFSLNILWTSSGPHTVVCVLKSFRCFNNIDPQVFYLYRFLLSLKLSSEIRICFKVLHNLMCKPGLRTTRDKYISFTSGIFLIAIAIPVLFNHFSVGFLVFSYHINSAVANILVHPYTLVLSIEKAQKCVCCAKVYVDMFILNISSSSQFAFLKKSQ